MNGTEISGKNMSKIPTGFSVQINKYTVQNFPMVGTKRTQTG